MEYPVGLINSLGLQDCSYSEKKHKNQGLFALKNKNVKLFAQKAKLPGKE
jgi:hypothetical protein